MSTPIITTGGKERLGRATALLSSVFATDPVTTYMLASLSPQRRLAYLPEYFHVLLTAGVLDDALFDEAADWGSCAVMMKPRTRVDSLWTMLQAGLISLMWNVKLGGVKRMLLEFVPLSDGAKAKGLGKQKDYYYLYFIGTRKDRRGEGLCSTLVRHYQTIAAHDNVPIWLEATTAHSMGIYSKLGFQVVEEITFGKGKAAEDGTLLKGGIGVKTWFMVWWPESLKK